MQYPGVNPMRHRFKSFSVCWKIFSCYTGGMDKERKGYNTTLRTDLLKQIKILAIEQDRRVNDLLEEAITDLLKKYSAKKPPK